MTNYAFFYVLHLFVHQNRKRFFFLFLGIRMSIIIFIFVLHEKLYCTKETPEDRLLHIGIWIIIHSLTMRIKEDEPKIISREEWSGTKHENICMCRLYRGDPKNSECRRLSEIE